MSLRVKFWGTRGSIPRAETSDAVLARLRAVLQAATPADIATPAAIDAYLQNGCRGALPTVYGGNTACVEVVEPDGPSLLIDLGSGARDYASHTMAAHEPAAPQSYHVLISHLHWDHIMGFPFFAPAYVPDNVIHIHACHAHAEAAFRRQHGAPSFPVAFEDLAAEIVFHTLAPDRAHRINGFTVTPHALPHPGVAYGFRIARSGQTVVYASDAEHKRNEISADYPYVDFIRGADALIFDAQYSLADATSAKEDWGHSSNVAGVELARLGDVKRLVLFHHDPQNDDAKLDAVLRESRQLEAALRGGERPIEIISAYDGLELAL